jgi:hypothetical protein
VFGSEYKKAEEVHTPRGDNCYLISGFLTYDDVDDHNHHHYPIVSTGNIIEIQHYATSLC